MKKVSLLPKKVGVTLLLAVFTASLAFISPAANASAATITYSDPIEYSVTTYENSASVQNYEPITVEVEGRPYTYYTVTTAQDSNQQAKKAAIETKTIAKNTKYATNLYIINSGKPGPVVMITGGVHGNETAGYKAADKVKNYKIKKGTLIVIPAANKLAIEAGKRRASGGSDLNRMFPQSSSASPSDTLSKAIYDVVKEYKVDWLMDMHESIGYYKDKSGSYVGQTIIYYPANGTINTVEYMVNELNKGINTSMQKFSILRYPVQGSLARSSAQFLGVNSFILETCSKQTLATRVSQQEKGAQSLLTKLGML